jgi:predicted phage-related endonuclease
MLARWRTHRRSSLLGSPAAALLGKSPPCRHRAALRAGGTDAIVIRLSIYSYWLFCPRAVLEVF